jgi:hypothetical protein
LQGSTVLYLQDLKGSSSTLALERLRSASRYRDVEKALVISAIAALEESAAPPIDPELVSGRWELVFSSLIGSGYFPVKEVCDFYKFELCSSWGPISLGGFEGVSRIACKAPLVN